MKGILTIVLLLIVSNAYCQVLQSKYYNNSYLERETTPQKAKFMQTVIQNTDGSITKQVTNIKKNEIIITETFKGREPVGIWKYKGHNIPNGLDYSFDLVYSDEYCKDSIAGMNDYFESNDSLHYIAPKILTGERTIYQFISKTLIYPSLARENDIQGKIYLTFIITKDGNVENIVVKEGVHIVLDKEAVRVIRSLKFSNPPTFNGQPKQVCLTLPVSFKLE